MTHTLIPSLLSGLLIVIWPQAWSRRPTYPPEEKRRSQAQMALLVCVVTLAFVFSLIVLAPAAFADETSRSYRLIDVIGQLLASGIVLLPFFAATGSAQLEPDDLQLRWRGALPGAVLGTVIGLVFAVALGKTSALPRLLSPWGIYAALQFLIVAVAEEVLFRGYLQVRWVAVLGWEPGWLAASLAMSAFHLPQYLIAMDMSWTLALRMVMEILPLSLLMGYSLRKSGNLAAPIAAHLWLNLIQTL